MSPKPIRSGGLLTNVGGAVQQFAKKNATIVPMRHALKSPTMRSLRGALGLAVHWNNQEDLHENSTWD